MDYLTVEKLLDIVQSQLCVHGNRAVFVEPNDKLDDANIFTLFAGGVDIVECVAYSESAPNDTEEYGLEVIAARLSELDESAIIEFTHNTPMDVGFRIGFKAEGRFVETINHKELQPQTTVAE